MSGYGASPYGTLPYGDPYYTFLPPVSTLGSTPSAFPIRCYAYDLNVGSLITELKVTGLSWSERINDAGECAFSLALADPAGTPINQQILEYGGAPYKLIIDSQGVILYSGIVWTTNYDSLTREMACSGKALMSFFDHQTISRDYSAATYPTGLYQSALLQKVITDCQADRPSANIGVGAAIVAEPVGHHSDIIVPSYARTSYPMVAQVMSDVTAALTPGTGGVDYTLRDSYSPTGLPVHTCYIQTPRCGRVAGKTGLFVDLSKSAAYTWPTDASLSGNELIAVGSGTGTAQLVSVATSGIAVGGLGQPPLLQAVLSYNMIRSATELAAMARGAAHNIGGPAIVTPTVTVPIDYAPAPLGSFIIGDDILVICPPKVDPRFPLGFSQYWRIVAYTVSVPDAGVPTMTFTLNAPPIF